MGYIKPLKQNEMNPLTLDYVKQSGRCCYPSYRGRKWSIGFQESYQMENYWDGGSRTYAVAIDLVTRQIKKPSDLTTSPFNKEAGASFEIPPGIGIVENIIFCGVQFGIRLVIRPDETKVIGYMPLTNLEGPA